MSNANFYVVMAHSSSWSGWPNLKTVCIKSTATCFLPAALFFPEKRGKTVKS